MNRRDGRFLLREKKIQKVLNSLPNSGPVVCMTNAKFAKRAKIGRATFRRHYKGIEEAFCVQRREIFQDFRREAKNYQGCAVNKILRFILIFIYQHKSYFRNDLFHCDSWVLKRMFEFFKVEICDEKGIMSDDFDFYVHKIEFFIKKWGKNGFDFEDIANVLREMLTVTTKI